ncbi:hypothetical protein HCB37_03725 [Listeria booriae]|uniref:hypothetical protein n=1 Tax=Listeria booriae TaxID=1552123 RepID=UPI001629A776|nr:hypothetical protein [Listeria booriae]MBC2263620.1 hypothetical protein [Listeria booriae]
MGQQKLYFKKFYKNKGNWLPIIVFIVAILFVLIMNTRVSEDRDFTAMAQDEIKANKEILILNEQTMKDSAKTEKDKADFEASEKINKARVKEQEKMVDLYTDGKWAEAYRIKIHLLKESFGLYTGEMEAPAELKESIYRQIAIYTKLEQLNIKSDQEDMETQGATFLYRTLANFVPVLFVIILCFTLNTIFTDRFRNNLDRDLLLPQKYTRATSERLLFGLLLSITFYVISGVIAYLSASLLSGTGSFSYPIAINMEPNIVTKPVGELLFQTMCLQVLTIVLVVLTLDLVSKLCKRVMPTLFISLLVLISPVLAVGKIEPLNRWAHLLPGTYFNATSISDSYLSMLCDNGNINFENGILVLSIAILILLLVNYVIDSRRGISLTLNTNQKRVQ